MAFATDLPVKRLHKARSGALDIRACKSCSAEWRFGNPACLAPQHTYVVKESARMLYDQHESWRVESRAGSVRQPSFHVNKASAHLFFFF